MYIYIYIYTYIYIYIYIYILQGIYIYIYNRASGSSVLISSVLRLLVSAAPCTAVFRAKMRAINI